MVIAGLGLLSFTGMAQALPLCGTGFGPCRPGLEFGVFAGGLAVEGALAKTKDGAGAIGHFTAAFESFEDAISKLGEKVSARSGQMAQEQNLSKDASCLANSGIYFRSGYQLNLGRREAGEYVGVVMHRVIPGESIRGNVDWLSTGDCGGKNRTYLQDCSQFPEIRHKNDWNHLRVMFKGERLQIWLNDKQITDVTDKLMAGEESWAAPAPKHCAC
jgi:hypothetical protein